MSTHQTKTFFLSRLACLLLALQLSACGVIGYGGHRMTNTQPVYHYVKTGETLYQIAKKYGVAPDKLALLNGIRNTRSLNVGERLLIGYSGRGRGIDTQMAGGSVGHQLQHGRVVYRDGKLAWPVAEGRLGSPFGVRHGAFHDGIDIAAVSGTPVTAAHDGLVIYAGNGLSGYGNLVILRGRSGMTTVYAHNRRIMVNVGESVERGDKISEVGSTGRSSGPHLHFEVRMKDYTNRFAAVDPLPFFQKSSEHVVDYRINERLTPILVRRP